MSLININLIRRERNKVQFILISRISMYIILYIYIYVCQLIYKNSELKKICLLIECSKFFKNILQKKKNITCFLNLKISHAVYFSI